MVKGIQFCPPGDIRALGNVWKHLSFLQQVGVLGRERDRRRVLVAFGRGTTKHQTMDRIASTIKYYLAQNVNNANFGKTQFFFLIVQLLLVLHSMYTASYLKLTLNYKM